MPRELITLMFNKINFNSIMTFLEITMSQYGRVQHNITGSNHDFIVYHNVSRKFSDFLAEAARAMGEDLSKLQVLNVDSKILSFKIEETVSE